MTDHILIHADALLSELRDAEPCQDCAGGLGVHVDLTDPEGWEVVQMHDVPCVAMTRPRRIRWNRFRGPLPPGAKSVMRPSRYGNPYTVADHGRERAVELYREHLRANPELVERVRLELAGRDLACSCELTENCHGDVLLRVAAGGEP